MVTLHLGERSGTHQPATACSDQVFASFDASAWLADPSSGSHRQRERRRIGALSDGPDRAHSRINKLDVTVADPAKAECDVNLTGENLETIEKAGWSTDLPLLVIDLPLPLPNEGSKQTLHIHLPSQPAPDAQLFIWLRGELKPGPPLRIAIPAALTTASRTGPDRMGKI